MNFSLSKIDRKVDYIILGQGLAGSALALELLGRGKRVMVFDDLSQNRCSVEAAGLFNPITGKVFAKTWLADKLFPALFDFYIAAERLTGERFFHPSAIYRPFISIEEQNEWMGRSSAPGFGDYIETIFLEGKYHKQVYDPYGGIQLKQCGYVNVIKFLNAVRVFLEERESYTSRHVAHEEISVSDKEVSVGSVTADKLIFCNGASITQSSFFKWLPVRPLKGETLEITLGETAEVIYNRGVYVVPFNVPGRYKIGATYQHDAVAAPTESGRKELEDKLGALIKIPYQMMAQGWGIRPTSPDRKPILGPHPDHQNLIIFNGMGTKGVSLVPYFSVQLAQWLTGGGEIAREVNINRFNALYSKSIGGGSNL